MKAGLNLLTVWLVVNSLLLVPAGAQAWSVRKLKGQVTIESKGNESKGNGSKGNKTAAAIGIELKEGDVVETSSDGKVMLVDQESEIWLVPGTRLKMLKLVKADQSMKGQLDILNGKLRAKIKKPSGPEDYPYEIRMKALVAGVRGTEFFMSLEGEEEKIYTLEGMVRVTTLKSAGEGWDVGAGKGLFAKVNEMPKVRATTPEQIKTWLDLSSF